MYILNSQNNKLYIDDIGPDIGKNTVFLLHYAKRIEGHSFQFPRQVKIGFQKTIFRQRILTQDEFTALLDASEPHLKPIVQMAYHMMGLRKDEIVRLTWPEVDLKKGFIRLPAERTKTDSPRIIPLHPEVKVTLEKLPRGLHTDRVFLRHGPTL